MPMSLAKPCSASKVQPERTIVIRSARNVFETKPPSVATAHSAKKTTKNSRPSPRRGPGATGRSGFKLLNEAGISQALQIRDLLDDADLEQQIGRFLAELRVFAGEELLV